MGLDMYLEASFSTRAYVSPTDADYEAMREGEEVKLEKSSELEDAISSIGFEDAPNINGIISNMFFLSSLGEKLMLYISFSLTKCKMGMITANVIMYQEKRSKSC